MKPIPATLDIFSPRALHKDDSRPEELARVSVEQLCQRAGIPMRVSTDVPQRVVVLHAGNEDFRAPGFNYVGIGGLWAPGRIAALRVLERLAYGFHDYVARECVCGRGLFCAPKKRGRPLLTGQPLTAAARMRRHRARRASAAKEAVVGSIA